MRFYQADMKILGRASAKEIVKRGPVTQGVSRGFTVIPYLQRKLYIRKDLKPGWRLNKLIEEAEGPEREIYRDDDIFCDDDGEMHVEPSTYSELSAIILCEQDKLDDRELFHELERACRTWRNSDLEDCDIRESSFSDCVAVYLESLGFARGWD